MSDSAFKSASFPGYTTKELQRWLVDVEVELDDESYLKVVAEVERRAKIAEGDVSVMTQGERLRYIRTGKAR